MRNSSAKGLLSSLVFVAMGCASSAHAAPAAFSERGAFDAAVAGLANVSISTLDFDGFTAGDLIASGDTLGGITFTYNFGGVSLQVTSGADTTSPSNYLGTDDAGMLQDGDNIHLGFAARNAIGLYVLSIDPLIDDDFRLSVGGYSASLTAASPLRILDDGTSVYFLGIVDTAATFTSASLTTSHDGETGFYLWNADDMVTAVAQVPEPETWAMLLAGLGLVRLQAMSRTRRQNSGQL